MIALKSAYAFGDKKNDVLAVGELLVDMVSIAQIDSLGAYEYRQYFGGSPANIAMNVKKLGVNSLVVACVGQDRLGDFLINHLNAAGISAEYIQRADDSTSLVVVNKSSTSPIPIFYRGADHRISYAPALESAVVDSKIIHFSCWPISMPHSRSTVEKILTQARKSQNLICFDPNYHYQLWNKGENGREYVKSIIGMADIVKPSEDDAERIFGKGEPEKQIEKFLTLGAKLVIMTLGKDGVLVCNGLETLRLPSLATKVEDTTGAGDAFWSGFYAALIKGYAVKEAVSFGCAVSAYKLKYVGAVANLPKLEKIKEMYAL